MGLDLRSCVAFALALIPGQNRDPLGDPWPGVDEGPDDWPENPTTEQIDEAERPEIIVTPQWGLRKPDGVIEWNEWQSVPFNDPFSRLQMIAKLGKTAEDIGFDESEFLSQYGWVTRNQIAACVYEDTGVYGLQDVEVSEGE